MAWTWSLSPTGVNEFTPLVHDGVMFVWNYGETSFPPTSRTTASGSLDSSAKPRSSHR